MKREIMLVYDRLCELKRKYAGKEHALRLLDGLIELVEVDGLTLEDVGKVEERLGG